MSGTRRPSAFPQSFIAGGNDLLFGHICPFGVVELPVMPQSWSTSRDSADASRSLPYSDKGACVFVLGHHESKGLGQTSTLSANWTPPDPCDLHESKIPCYLSGLQPCLVWVTFWFG